MLPPIHALPNKSFKDPPCSYISRQLPYGCTQSLGCPCTLFALILKKFSPLFRIPLCKPSSGGYHRLSMNLICIKCSTPFLTKLAIWFDKNLHKHLSQFVAIFNWICLSLFTSSCSSEYCQTGVHCHSFSKVSTDAVAVVHASEPIAFIISNFHFFTEANIIISTLDKLLNLSTIKKLQL